MVKTAYSVRLDTVKSQAVQELAEEKGISESDALRLLIHNGIEYQRTTRHINDELIEIHTEVSKIEKQTQSITQKLFRFLSGVIDEIRG